MITVTITKGRAIAFADAVAAGANGWNRQATSRLAKAAAEGTIRLPDQHAEKLIAAATAGLAALPGQRRGAAMKALSAIFAAQLRAERCNRDAETWEAAA